MRAQAERPQLNTGLVLGGLALLGLPWWAPNLALPICLGVVIGALAVIVGRARITESEGWPRARVLVACGALGLLGGGSWPLVPSIAVITLVGLACAALASGKRNMATNDRLTGLLNQRAFSARAEEELSRGLRFGRPVTLAIIMVDGAPAIRERYGRRGADLALAHIAEALRGQSRTYDLLARLDDAHFAMLLPETTRDEASKVTNRIGMALAASPLTLPDEERALTLGVTVELTEYPTEGLTLQPLSTRPQRATTVRRYGALALLAKRLVNIRPYRHQATAPAQTNTLVLGFITLIWIATFTLFIATMSPIPQELWGSFALMIGIGTVSRAVRVNLYGRSSISNHFVAIMAGSILFGPTGAMILAAIIGLYHRPWTGVNRKNIFDAGSYALIAGVLSLLEPALKYYLPGEMWLHLPLIGQGLILGIVCYALNAGTLITVIALTSRLNPYSLWRQEFAWFVPYTLIFGVLAVFMVQSSLAFGPLGLLVFAAPAFMILLATKQYIDQTKTNVVALNEAHQRLSELNGQLSASVDELQQAYTATLEAFSGMLDARDSETEGHSKRVVRCVLAIGKEMALTAAEMSSLEVGALLHDIGKVGVSDQILRKNGPLSDEEWVEMRKHPEIGYGLTSRISFLDHALPIVRHHHERWDGNGYPDGLFGENIPLAARIFSVADSFDAMVSDRPYRRGMPLDRIVEELQRGAGKQFDPHVVAVFLTLLADETWLAAIRSPRTESQAQESPLRVPAHN